VSLALGRLLFDEHLRGGTFAVTAQVVSLALMLLGAVGLSTSSLVTGLHDDATDAHLLHGRGRYARWRESREHALPRTATR